MKEHKGKKYSSRQFDSAVDKLSKLYATTLPNANAPEKELRLSEAGLRESQARFSTAFRASPLNITILRLSDARFVQANDAFVNWLGLAARK